MTADLEARVAELRAELDSELEQLLEAGLCGCGCGEPIDGGGNGRRRYRDGHRQRAHRRRVELEAKVRGVPARLSLKALEATNPPRERHADAQTKPRRPRRPRPGVTVYLPSVEAAERVWDAIAADDELEPILEAAIERRRKRAA